MDTNPPLQAGSYYHIYNRGNNREKLFFEERNYEYFLKLYIRYVSPIADTFAYCLMGNHFHLLVRIKTEEEYIQLIKTSQYSYPDNNFQKETFQPSKHFSNLFNAYTKAINKAYGRTGSLFEECFKRLPVTSDSYFLNLIFYIHYNPQKHGFVDNFRDWRWSSYEPLNALQSNFLKRDEVLNWFGGPRQYQEYHQGTANEKKIAAIMEEDDSSY